MRPNPRVVCSLLLLTLLVSPCTHALDANCLPFVDAADKSAHQPARQSVTELEDGTRMEAIVVDDVLYSKLNGKWMKVRSGFWSMERSLVADMRSGAIALTQCKTLGRENVDGVETTVIEYTMKMPGGDPGASKVYVGDDGLIHAQHADSVKVRYRYQGVRAPQL